MAAAETHAAVAKVCLMVCLLCRDFDVDAAGPQCMFYWTWHHDLILQFSLPVMVRIVGIRPLNRTRLKLPLTSTNHLEPIGCLLQCVLVNCVQYMMACALLVSPVSHVRVLRMLIQAPASAEVTPAGGPTPCPDSSTRIHPRPNGIMCRSYPK